MPLDNRPFIILSSAAAAIQITFAGLYSTHGSCTAEFPDAHVSLGTFCYLPISSCCCCCCWSSWWHCSEETSLTWSSAVVDSNSVYTNYFHRAIWTLNYVTADKELRLSHRDRATTPLRQCYAMFRQRKPIKSSSPYARVYIGQVKYIEIGRCFVCWKDLKHETKGESMRQGYTIISYPAMDVAVSTSMLHACRFCTRWQAREIITIVIIMHLHSTARPKCAILDGTKSFDGPLNFIAVLIERKYTYNVKIVTRTRTYKVA